MSAFFPAVGVAWPCDRGTGRPVGYHHYQASLGGEPVCIYCGSRPVANKRREAMP